MDCYLEKQAAKLDGVKTQTSEDQTECERTCSLNLLPLFPEELSTEEKAEFVSQGILNESGEVVLLRKKHASYLLNGLQAELPAGFISLDASRPWIIYWIVHSLELLEAEYSHLTQQVIDTLTSCWDSAGGFGGGPGQMAHCAPTYAGVMTLLTIGTEQAYKAIRREELYKWFVSLKHESGGIRMHHDGEVDVRGTYTAVAVASLLNMLTPELSAGVAEYCLQCQTYEGGFGGEPGNEAHGGYTFCAYATLCILGRQSEVDTPRLASWLCHRQMKLEGGFQGRTNKLVDGCYSYWQGGAAALLEYAQRGRVHEVTHRTQSGLLSAASDEGLQPAGKDSIGPDGIPTFGHFTGLAGDHSGALPFNQTHLQQYILLCAQQANGGLRDKPLKSRDYYHTCYNLSGLSIAQHCLSPTPTVLGDPANELVPTNPVYNITESKTKAALQHYSILVME